MMVADDELFHGDDHRWAWVWATGGWVGDDDAIGAGGCGQSQRGDQDEEQTGADYNGPGFHNLLLN